ncbi:metallophosphoesterase [Cesiribacter sp. SM1]|uniref:metallophosphoesterase n=1 Tax=Cesiribacter sp. SM1 TaxID=2861196 RepID=UPI001CD4966C|nr:metallophosphoesterase [Cesiribacter sp. SM1]
MNIKWIKWGLAASFAGAAVVLLDALFLEKYFFECKSFSIGSSKRNKNLKLLLITDLHIKKVYWPYYEKLARTINTIKPDLILIAGDTLDGDTKAATVEKFFSRISVQIKKVAIAGNHDHIDKLAISSLQEIYSRYNCDLLINRSQTYMLQGERFVITGLDDFIESDSCFLEAVEGVGREENHILLIHSPLQQEPVLARLKELNATRSPADQLNISYIFAGHNHGGQVRFLNLVPKLPLMSGRYVNGWYNKEQPYLYLSKGFGTSTLPFRFGARSEINLFNYWL